MSFEGLLLIDKPTGCTSHDVVARVRKVLNIKKVGHAGTLDPLATGLMVVLVGKATRLSDYLLNGDKAYEVEVQLGIETDTLDAHGVETARWQGPLPTSEEAKAAALSVKGELELQVPDYSAVKVDGKKLYEYARNGEAVPQILKTMKFDKVEWLGAEGSKFSARIYCSKGSFIRTWAYEVGRRLGVGAHVTQLRRIESAPYSIAQSIKLEDFENDGIKGLAETTAIPIKSAMNHRPEILLNTFEEKLMLSGQIPEGIYAHFNGEFPDQVRVMGFEGRLLAILERTESGGLQIGCVLASNL